MPAKGGSEKETSIYIWIYRGNRIGVFFDDSHSLQRLLLEGGCHLGILLLKLINGLPALPASGRSEWPFHEFRLGHLRC